MLSPLADLFFEQLRDRAALNSWTLEPSPLLEDDHRDPASSLIAALEEGKKANADTGTVTLPAFRRAVELRPVSISVLVSGFEEAERKEDTYRAALWWAGTVRARMVPLKRGDLHLFLIGPQGSRERDEWRTLRSEVEADERFCRKFVWLPSAAPEPREVEQFLERTFLGRPWEAERVEPGSLDPVQQVVDQGDQNLTLEEKRLWIEILGALDKSAGQEMAEELVEALWARP